MGLDRRDFLKVLGVATGTAAAAGCDLERNTEKLIPYLVPPEDGRIEGEATYVNSTCTECPAGCGVTARIREDRPVKLEGAAGHPLNDGGLCMRGQASLNRMYHTERIRTPLASDGNGNLVPVTWNQANDRVVRAMRDSGDKLFLSRHTTGSLSELAGEFCESAGVERLPEYELYSHAAIRSANQELLGVPVAPAYRYERADFVLTVGADVMDTFQNPVAATGAILGRMREDSHFKWYHAEPYTTVTGLRSPHRLALKPGSEAALLACLLHEMHERRIFTDRRLEGHVSSLPSVSVDDAAGATGLDRQVIAGLLDDLMAAHHPLVLAGGVSTAHDNGLDVARLATLLQVAADMIGDTVDFGAAPDQAHLGMPRDMEALAGRLDAGGVDVLFLHDTDPVSQLPDGRAFGASLQKAGFLVGIGDMLTETMQQCDVVLPLSHALESAGDVEPRRGLVGAIAPAIKPLYDTRSAGDILIGLMNQAGYAAPAPDFAQYATARWARVYGGAALGDLLQKGWARVSAASLTPSLQTASARWTFNGNTPGGSVLLAAPSIRWYDGRSRELPLLQEIPDPLTTVTWDRWVSISMASAEKHGVADGDILELSAGAWTQSLPARRQPGLPEGVHVVHRGITNTPGGVNPTSGEFDAWTQVSVKHTGRREKITVMAGSLTEDGRGAIPGDHPEHFGHGSGEHSHHKEDQSFYPEPNYPKYRWAMAVDMDLCTGCGACVAACYLENNIPMTGRDEHAKGREMSWLRIEPYYDLEHGTADFVPAMCQHCDYAPCEPVCPVFATYHSDEGLNAQVYNRCVGTRYCANNCSYKQRRFNWFSWDHRPEPLNLMVNPDVSVRQAGMMEKCTFCVQRIRKARDVAKDENRDILEGDVTTACQQSCPGKAIAFGNLLDEESEVYKWASSDRSNRLLDELGTSPGVYYLRSKGSHHDA